MGVGGQRHATAALPPGKTRCPLCRRLGGPQDRSGRVRKISPPQGFDPRTVHPVASRYTDCAILAHWLLNDSTCKTRFRSYVLPQKTALLADAFLGTVWLNKCGCEFDDGKCLNREEPKGVLMFLRNWKSTRVFKFVLSRRYFTKTTSWRCDAVNCMLVDKYCEWRSEISLRHTILLLPHNYSWQILQQSVSLLQHHGCPT